MPQELLYSIKGHEVLFHYSSVQPEAVGYSIVIVKETVTRILYFSETNTVHHLPPQLDICLLGLEEKSERGVYLLDTKSYEQLTVFLPQTKWMSSKELNRYLITLAEGNIFVLAKSFVLSTQIEANKLTATTYLNNLRSSEW